MTSTSPDPLEQPVDTEAGDESAGTSGPGGRAAAAAAPVSGSPAEADSDVGYSRGADGESVEQAGAGSSEGGGTDYLDTDTLMGGPGDPRNG